MEMISTYLTDDHHLCDDLFSNAEEVVAQSDWASSQKKFAEFQCSLEHHLSMEENELFPAIEQHTGSAMGPTQMMRQEHTMMRELLQEMASALQDENQEQYLDLSETLLIMMQQHNMKEEQILYPMADQMLDNKVLIASMKAMHKNETACTSQDQAVAD